MRGDSAIDWHDGEADTGVGSCGDVGDDIAAAAAAAAAAAVAAVDNIAGGSAGNAAVDNIFAAAVAVLQPVSPAVQHVLHVHMQSSAKVTLKTKVQ